MREGVIDHLVNHGPHRSPVVVVACVMQLVDVFDDALVLAVDFTDAGFQVRCPVEICHGIGLLTDGRGHPNK